MGFSCGHLVLSGVHRVSGQLCGAGSLSSACPVRVRHGQCVWGESEAVECVTGLCVAAGELTRTDTAFAQQKLRAWQPILTPLPVIISFLVIGFVFIPVGVVLLETSNAVRPRL